jgi:hypothetical protein
MPDFNVRSDSVDVEQIMEQIRARIREKRGVDYTEQQIRELAAVKLEKFLDPSGVRSDLLEQFRKAQPAYTPPDLPNYAFEAETLFESTRAPIRWIRKLLNPILKLFFNPNPLIQVLNIQSRLNTMYGEREGRREATRRAFDQLQYELMHNLVIETTRMSIEVKNLKMRVESLASRLEFNERRSRALESVVVYKPSADPVSEPAASSGSGRPAPQEPRARSEQSRGAGTGQPTTPRENQSRSDFGRGMVSAPQPLPAAPPARESQEHVRPLPIVATEAAAPGPAALPGGVEGPGQRSRRRRRRRGRRSGGSAVSIMGGAAPAIAETRSTESIESILPGPDDRDPTSAPPLGSDAAPSSAEQMVDEPLAGPPPPISPVVHDPAVHDPTVHDAPAEREDLATAPEAPGPDPDPGGTAPDQSEPH